MRRGAAWHVSAQIMAGHLTHGNSLCWKTLSPPLLGSSWSLTRSAIFLAIPLPAGPAAITSVMVVSSDSTGNLNLFFLRLGALAAVMAITAVILISTSLAEAYINARVTSVFSRITAIILATLSIKYIIDRLQTLDGLPIS
jgi:small neutral amino acid transporter SnatA (MarC family)